MKKTLIRILSLLCIVMALFSTTCCTKTKNLTKEPPKDALTEAYKKVLSDIIANPENYYKSDGFSSLEDQSFAIADIDDNGEEELIVKFDNTYTAAMHSQIWRYDKSNKTAYHAGETGVHLTFYSNGYVTSGAYHNQSYGTTMWPYTTEKYNTSTNEYDFVFSASSLEKDFCETTGKLFPEEIDKDGDGIVYRVSSSTDYEKYYDLKDYENFKNKYIPDNNEITVTYTPLTAQNVSNL